MLEDVILVKIRFLNENQIFKSFWNLFEMMFQFIIKIMKILENHVNEMKNQQNVVLLDNFTKSMTKK